MNAGAVFAIAGIASAVALAGFGSAVGIKCGAEVAAGVLTEDPSKFGKLIPLIGLPGTQGIYGFVCAFFAVIQLKLLSAEGVAVLQKLTVPQGMIIFLMCLPVALAGLVSAIHQGLVCAAGIAMCGKRISEMGKAMVMGIFVEFYAVLGFLMTFLLLLQIPKIIGG